VMHCWFCVTQQANHNLPIGKRSVVKAEFIAMRLAALARLNVASVSMTQAANKDVLLIERFDRVHVSKGWQRKAIVSGLTLFGLDEVMTRYASYEDLAEIIRYRFRNASVTLKELFSRLVFNILCGNTDDHARNHAAFWDGEMLSLTPFVHKGELAMRPRKQC